MKLKLSDEFAKIIEDMKTDGSFQREALKVEISEAIWWEIHRQKRAKLINQAELARRMGITRQSVQHILNGNNLTLETLADVATALGCQWEFKLKENK